ncbi:Uncharacterised protein [uncultured archaeon]|nr:Uncharacterised protein [uncultured archaeon]
MNVAKLMVRILPGLEEVEAQHFSDLEELIGKGDVNVPVAALHHLDHLCDLGRAYQMKIGNEPLVDLISQKSALLVCSTDHFRKLTQSRKAVAGHDPLRRVGQEEIAQLQAAGLLQPASYLGVRGAGRKSGLQNDKISSLQDLAQGPSRLLHDGEVRVEAWVHENGYYYYEGLADSRIIESRRGHKALSSVKPYQLLQASLLRDGIDSPVDESAALCVDIHAHNLDATGGHNSGQRQPGVAKANDCYLPCFLRHIPYPS